MERGEAIVAVIGAVQQRWGPHSLTRGWSGGRPMARPAGLGRPPWWPSAPGLAKPAVIELAGPPSCGKLSLALLWLADAWEGGLIAIVDETRRFYPPAAAACGLDLERLVVVRPPSPRAAIEATGLLLGSEGFDAVLWPVDPKTRPDGATGAKLAHLASRSGTTLLTLVESPKSKVQGRGPFGRWALDFRLAVAAHEWLWTDDEPGGTRVLRGVRLRVRAERLRGGVPGRDWELVLARSIDDDGTPDRLRLDAAFPAGSGESRATGAERAADRDLQAERTLAGAG